MFRVIKCRGFEQGRNLALLLLALATPAACTMTSDLDDLRRRAEAAQRGIVLDPCEINPSDPECMPTTVMCLDNPNCDGYCDDQGACRPEACRDHMISLGETSIDCGGQSCTPCPNDQACTNPGDCISGICEDSTCVATASDPPERDAGDDLGEAGGPIIVEPEGGDAQANPECIPGCLCMTIEQIPRIFCAEMPLSWAGASSFCQTHDMLLTPIETRIENDALGNMAEWMGLASFWIGASDRSEESDWDWTDGTNLWNGGAASCPEGAVKGPKPDNHCYLATSSGNYSRTYADCLAEGAGWSLTIIGSLDENDFVQELIDTTATMRNAQYHGGWIGANDWAMDGTWGWVLADPDPKRVTPFWMGGAGGQKLDPTTFTNWSGNNPGGGAGEGCGSMSGATGRWMDDACTFDAYMGICEGPMRGPIEGTYHAFAETEPQTADCLSYNALDFRWYAEDCALSKPFVCSAP